MLPGARQIAGFTAPRRRIYGNARLARPRDLPGRCSIHDS
jgi:hypothetical protein